MEFVISDLHFNHANIIKYCNRPFHNVNEMNEMLIYKWNQVVGMNDIVYHLGDFLRVLPNENGYASYTERALMQVRNVVQRLNGKIIYLDGNHKSIKKNQAKAAGILAFYNEPIYKDKFIMTHYPMKVVPKGKINIHGHIHNTYFKTLDDHMHINVSAEVLDYVPTPFEKLNPIVDKSKYIDEQEEYIWERKR